MMEGKVIVITGGSQGIGKALALNLASKGCKLVLAARTAKTLDLAVKECGENIAIGVVTDVTNKSDHEALLARALTVFGRVDVWVNNAGAGLCKLKLDLTEEDFDLMMSVNCKSVLYGMQTIIPYFKQQSRGHVINVTSLLSHMPTAAPLYSMYSASKAALNSLTANMHTDIQKEGYKKIQISLFIPGLTATDFAANAINSVGNDNMTNPYAQPVNDVAKKIVQLIHTRKPVMYSKFIYYILVVVFFLTSSFK